MTIRKVFVAACAALAVQAACAQYNHTYSGLCNLPVPPAGSGGAPGGVSNAQNKTSFSIDVPIGIVIEHVSAQVNLSHTAVGDLRIELSHCGTTVVLSNTSSS